MSNSEPNFEAMFSGVIGKDYDMLKLICPSSIEMSHRVGDTVAKFPVAQNSLLKAVELGGGTGITTLAILSAAGNIELLSIDNEPTMQNQAKANLKQRVDAGKLSFSGDDALSALQKLPSNSVHVVASAYTLHNFPDTYRSQVVEEIYRVLVSGGWFVNGDRYALDDITEHTRSIQREVSGYFDVLTKLNRIDLLEHWIVHLFNDESENHVMRQTPAFECLKSAGFETIQLAHRQEVNALVTAVKPISPPA